MASLARAEFLKLLAGVVVLQGNGLLEQQSMEARVNEKQACLDLSVVAGRAKEGQLGQPESAELGTLYSAL